LLLPRPRMRVPAVFLALSVLTIAPRASATELSWDAPASCPDRATVETRVEKLVGGAKSDVVAEARVTTTKDGYHLTLVTTRGGVRGERALDDASCDALAESAALIVAMAIDPAAALAADETPPQPTPTPLLAAPTPNELPPPSSEIVVAPPVDEPVEPAPTRRKPALVPRFLASVGGDVVANVFPGAALGASASVGVLLDRVRLDVGGRYSPSRDYALSAPAGASGEFELLVGTARGAWLWTVGAWELAPTLGLEAGRARGRGRGVSTSLEGRALWLAASVGALATLHAGSFGLTGELALLAPLTRPSFVIEGAGTVHTPAAVALRAGISAEFRF